jgi:chromosome segregation ATPase
LNDEIDNLKQIRSQQSSQIFEFENRVREITLEAEQDKKQIIEYKNKLATYMRNTTALEKELRSMTPPPRRDLIQDSKESSPTRVCHTADSIPSLSIEKYLSKLKPLIQHPYPESVLNFCKEILGQENFIIRFQDPSIISDESRMSDISSVSEANIQEGNYRAHSKMLEQKKMIQKLQTRLVEKKSRLKMFKGHIRALQEEIRRLDQELKAMKSLDLEHFKSIFQKFVGSLKTVDSESLKILQVLTGVLGIEVLPRVDSKKKWNLFAKKSK